MRAEHSLWFVSDRRGGRSPAPDAWVRAPSQRRRDGGFDQPGAAAWHDLQRRIPTDGGEHAARCTSRHRPRSHAWSALLAHQPHDSGRAAGRPRLAWRRPHLGRRASRSQHRDRHSRRVDAARARQHRRAHARRALSSDHADHAVCGRRVRRDLEERRRRRVVAADRRRPHQHRDQLAARSIRRVPM